MISLHKADQNLNSMQHKKINSTLLRIFRPKTMLNRHGVWVAGVRTASFVMTREVKLENGFGLMESVARQFLVPLLLPALVATVPQACDIPWHPVTSCQELGWSWVPVGFANTVPSVEVLSGVAVQLFGQFVLLFRFRSRDSKGHILRKDLWCFRPRWALQRAWLAWPWLELVSPTYS